MLEFNDLLLKADIDPARTLIMRHRPTDAGLRRVLPWFAAERPEIFNAYQQAQSGENAERALLRASYLASFIGEEPQKAHFVGVYKVESTRRLTKESYWKIPENISLVDHGMTNSGMRDGVLWFDLQKLDLLSELQGRLVIDWTGSERSWYRWAYRNTFPIASILETSAFNEQMPDWQDLTLSWAELKSLPKKWTQALSEWRGIYLIFDEVDGKSYVGSAYGAENILGRWKSYASTGHGGNKMLRKRNPATFRFSILQRVSPDLDMKEVVQIEKSWKSRLHTRDFGLNDN